MADGAWSHASPATRSWDELEAAAETCSPSHTCSGSPRAWHAPPLHTHPHTQTRTPPHTHTHPPHTHNPPHTHPPDPLPPHHLRSKADCLGKARPFRAGCVEVSVLPLSSESKQQLWQVNYNWGRCWMLAIHSCKAFYCLSQTRAYFFR